MSGRGRGWGGLSHFTQYATRTRTFVHSLPQDILFLKCAFHLDYANAWRCNQPRLYGTLGPMMIRPQTKIQADLYIHAAKEAVWQKYTQVHDWPTWQPNVSAVAWRQGDRWQEGAQFAVHDGQGGTATYIIRMVVPNSVTVWEAMNPAVSTVYSFHVADQVGGCKVTFSATYHGLGALTLWLQRGHRRRQLQATLEALKAYFGRK